MSGSFLKPVSTDGYFRKLLLKDTLRHSEGKKELILLCLARLFPSHS